MESDKNFLCKQYRYMKDAGINVAKNILSAVNLAMLVCEVN